MLGSHITGPRQGIENVVGKALGLEPNRMWAGEATSKLGEPKNFVVGAWQQLASAAVRRDHALGLGHVVPLCLAHGHHPHTDRMLVAVVVGRWWVIVGSASLEPQRRNFVVSSLERRDFSSKRCDLQIQTKGKSPFIVSSIHRNHNINISIDETRNKLKYQLFAQKLVDQDWQVGL